MVHAQCSKKTSIMRLVDSILQWYHAEDMEVSLKLISNGGSIVYAPEAVVAHVPESSGSDFLPNVLEMLELTLGLCVNIQKA